MNGSTCTRITSVAATPGYGCPDGGTLTGNTCVGTSSTKTAYIYLNGKPIAETVVNGATRYVHTDALGSPVAHTSQAGSELSRTNYEPYGNAAGGTKPGATLAGFTTTGSELGFTGHVHDPETELVYMQHRYYDPVAGRFLSVDPIMTNASTGGSFNRYSYANNSPYTYIDPDGRNPVGIARIAAAAGIQGLEKLIARRAWRKSEKELIENSAQRGPSGKKVCPDCQVEVNKFDINHRKKWGETQHEIIERARNGDAPSREDVLEMYGKDIDGKCAPCNRADNKLAKAGATGAAGAAASGNANASDGSQGQGFLRSLAEILVEVVISPTEAGAGSDIVPIAK